MIFTLYYMYSTFMQWWRLGALRNKITGTLNTHNALVVCMGNTIGEARTRRSLENLLFYNEDRIGCTVVPKQHLDLSTWLLFPRDLAYFPIYIQSTRVTLKPPHVFLLVQTHLATYTRHQSEIVQVEKCGELVAWRASHPHFEIILKTDMDNLTKLVNCFTDHTIDINHELQLLKIETVDVEGIPSRIKYDCKYPIHVRTKYSLAPRHWKHFADDLLRLYGKLNESPAKKLLEKPTITIEKTSKTVEPKRVPVSEVKPIKKVDAPTEERGAKNKLEVSSSSTSRRTKPKKAESRTRAKSTTDTTKEKSREPEERGKERERRRNSHDKHKERARDEHKRKRATDVPDQPQALAKRASSANATKPPNVLVYADSPLAKENVKNVLYSLLNSHKYTIYDLPLNVSTANVWMDTTCLVVVCGNVLPAQTQQCLDYLFNGGNLLCLCSDLLYAVLHMFSTAEVREHELVRFTYDNWKRVRMMHHVFCYQASPAKRQFSKDSDQSNSSRGSSPVAPRTPPSTVHVQHGTVTHTVQVQVLGTEETWHTPSLLLASVQGGKGGRAIFSQVHLEVDPTQYERDEATYEALTASNDARLAIFKHLLANHLHMDCNPMVSGHVVYACAYFLGVHESKMALLSTCERIKDNQLINEKLTCRFVGKTDQPPLATPMFLPILVHACPTNFSTVKYFETLKTKEIGRLVIYANVMTSSNFLIANYLKHGLAVIVRQQTQGAGRSNNTWLSPEGCAMFSLQLAVDLTTNLGRVLPLIQHVVMVAVVAAVKKHDDYKQLPIGIKWPNDLYAYGNVKVGGLMATSLIQSDRAVVNIGCGINLDNSEPTTCLNDVIRRHNFEKDTHLTEIGYEAFFARVFNEFEVLVEGIQDGGMAEFYATYYAYWLHSDAKITIIDASDVSKSATIVGIDEYGYLKVRTTDGATTSVHPDGNTFDILKGLIQPKV